MTGMGERVSELGYAAGWAVVRALPEPLARAVFRTGADVAARRQGPDSQLRKNLSRVLGVPPAEVPDELIRDSFRSYARYWREAFRLPSMDREAVAREMDRTIEGVEHLDAALAQGRGVVVALPHSANWDLGGTWLARRYGGFATVAERLQPESLYQRFLDFREGLGFTIYPHSGGPTPPLEALRGFLAGGGIVCLPGERDLRRTGVPVTFFGETTRMPAGAARLAVETGAPFLVAQFWYSDEETMRVRITPPIDVSGGVESAVQAMADLFAEGIARHPADWHMLQPLWLDDLSADRRARIEG
ncbi:phosphatidylinositol mannoside acyltransferase [Rhodococcus sp. IEGM 1408]|uniref:phosphatidylinositol mannoside acyltransferase n=1 Tax=Rhodococcus sp. IEGM 1408 TaxID=3082220 RepID=UPI0029535EFE|nr:phosphatidylinositol mannoside acyltransferase [Rhodococcus sp. IEGM 1408]MDV8000346.1 phosphatidylinositol mannoside acyltransferase [Rhodococcus sp. IEGM 1408]